MGPGEAGWEGQAVTSISPAGTVLALASLLALSACDLEKPDPASQAAAILHKRPSGFLDRLVSLDDLAWREIRADQAAASTEAVGPATPSARPILAESVYAYASRLRPAIAAAASDSVRADLLTSFVFDSLGIVPAPEDTTLASSLPGHVLAARSGSCLGLVLLHLALGRELGLPVVPVFLPGHTFVRFRSESHVRNIETLRGGIARSDSFYRESFSLAKRPWYGLADGRPEQALGALVFNLGNLHRLQGRWDAALWEYRLAEELLPGSPEALGNQGAVLLAAGNPDSARVKLEAALAGDSLAAPAWKNLETIYRHNGEPAKAEEAKARWLSLRRTGPAS
jgi:regulator of sirC expression with transglutaminase-like and TPR domain